MIAGSGIQGKAGNARKTGKARQAGEATEKTAERAEDKPRRQGDAGIGACHELSGTLAEKGTAFDEIAIGVIEACAAGDCIDFIAA
jgi:hypothetical protein